MKALHIISSGGMYGAEAVVLNLLRQLGQDAALVMFDNRSNSHLELADLARAEGLECHILRCAGQIDRSALGRLRTLARASGASLLHAHGYKADVYTAFAVDELPWISTCHNWCDTDLSTRIYGALDRRLLRRARAVVAVSSDVQTRLIRSGLFPTRVRVVRNGIDPVLFTPVASARTSSSGRTQIIGYAGRLSYEKGADLFVEVARFILAEHPGIRFRIAGDGPERTAIEAALLHHGLTEKVTLLGRLEDMPAFYRSIDLLLSPSRTEGLPIGLMEAMASGLAVVATAVGDVPTLVLDGITGALVPPENPVAFACAVSHLIADPDRAYALGRAGAARIGADFSAQSMAAAYRDIYRKVLRLDS